MHYTIPRYFDLDKQIRLILKETSKVTNDVNIFYIRIFFTYLIYTWRKRLVLALFRNKTLSKSIKRSNATRTPPRDFPFSSCDSWCVRTLRDVHSNGRLVYLTLFVTVILQSSRRGEQFRFKKEPRLRASLVTWLKRQSVSVHHEIMHWMKLKENITLSAKHVSMLMLLRAKRRNINVT